MKARHASSTTRSFSAWLVSACVLASEAFAGLPAAPVEQWRVHGPSADWDVPMLHAIPVVAQLTDDDGDGDVDADDRPDVAFLANSNGGNATGNLYVVDGETGVEHWRRSGAFGRINSATWSAASLAAGDLDGDGIAELVVLYDSGFLVFEHDGTEAFRVPADMQASARGHAVSVADLNHDGVAELIDLATVASVDGAWSWRGAVSGTDGHDLSWGLAADLRPELEGLELFAGNALYDAGGSVLWQLDAHEGSAAFGDVTGDGSVEIVLSTRRGFVRQLLLLDVEGNELLPPLEIGGGWHLISSAPLLAELDGDPTPELVLNANHYLSAMEWSPSGWVELWREPSEELRGASSVTAYDLDGDGLDELLHRDTEYWYVRDARCGRVLRAEPSPSLPGLELPVVANIDSDPAPEVLINQYTPYDYSTIALVAYELPLSCPSRAIWNQASYHVTNVGDDASIPVVETPAWEAGARLYAQEPRDADVEMGGLEPVVITAGSGCTGRVELSWPPAALSDGTPAVYDVWRLTESVSRDCCDERDGIPIAVGLVETSFVDEAGPLEERVRYLVRARTVDGRCATRRHCTADVFVTDSSRLPEPPGGVLRFTSGRTGRREVHWYTARAAALEEHYHLRRAMGSPLAVFELVLPEGSRTRLFSEVERGLGVWFYQLRVADSCENESPP